MIGLYGDFVLFLFTVIHGLLFVLGIHAWWLCLSKQRRQDTGTDRYVKQWLEKVQICSTKVYVVPPMHRCRLFYIVLLVYVLMLFVPFWMLRWCNCQRKKGKQYSKYSKTVSHLSEGQMKPPIHFDSLLVSFQQLYYPERPSCSFVERS